MKKGIIIKNPKTNEYLSSWYYEEDRRWTLDIEDAYIFGSSGDIIKICEGAEQMDEIINSLKIIVCVDIFTL